MAFIYNDFAAYAYLAQANRLDWAKIADMILDSGVFNGMTFMARNQWLQNDEMRDAQKWLKNKKKFSSIQNDEWFETTESVLDYLLSKKISITIKLMDEYLPPRYDIPMKFHPIVHNTFGALTVKEWYDSWVPGKGKTWLDWTDKLPHEAVNFRPANDIGKVHMAYFDRMFQMLGGLRAKYPGGRIAYSMHNETEGSARGVGNSLGDRHEIVQYGRSLAIKYGLKQGPKTRLYVNYNAIDVADQAEWNQMMKNAYSGSLGKWHRASNFEIHNIGEDHMVDDLIALFGPKSVFKLRGSTDSVQAKDDNAANRHLFKSKLVNREFKPEEKNWPGKIFNRNNLQKSVNFFIPALAKEITR